MIRVNGKAYSTRKPARNQLTAAIGRQKNWESTDFICSKLKKSVKGLNRPEGKSGGPYHWIDSAETGLK